MEQYLCERMKRMSGYPQQPQQFPGQPYPGQPQYPQGQYPQQSAGNPFADPQNPYAVPQMGGFYQPVMQTGNLPPFAGLWRQGNVLVMHRNAPLPEICLKSNQPAAKCLKRNLYWHHPAIFVLVLISPLIYIIVALIMQKRATINPAFVDEWLARRRTRIMIACAIIALSLLLFIGGIAMAESLRDATPIPIIAGIVLFFGA